MEVLGGASGGLHEGFQRVRPRRLWLRHDRRSLPIPVAFLAGPTGGVRRLPRIHQVAGRLRTKMRHTFDIDERRRPWRVLAVLGQ